MSNKNILYTSGQSISISDSETYTLKDNEVYVNNMIHKKEDLAVSFMGLCDNMDSEKVKVGIRIRLGNLTEPASPLTYSDWEIDGVEQTSLIGLVSSLKDALYFQNSTGSISTSISNIETVINALSKIKANNQKIYNLDGTNNTITFGSKTISYIEVICIGNGSTGKISVSPTGTNPVNEIDLNFDLLYKYDRNFNSYVDSVNPNDITVEYNGTGGILIVEIGEV